MISFARIAILDPDFDNRTQFSAYFLRNRVIKMRLFFLGVISEEPYHSLFSSWNCSTLQHRLKIPRKFPVKYVFLLLLQVKHAIHQFWTFWKTTGVSVDSSETT